MLKINSWLKVDWKLIESWLNIQVKVKWKSSESEKWKCTSWYVIRVFQSVCVHVNVERFHAQVQVIRDFSKGTGGWMEERNEHSKFKYIHSTIHEEKNFFFFSWSRKMNEDEDVCLFVWFGLFVCLTLRVRVDGRKKWKFKYIHSMMHEEKNFFFFFVASIMNEDEDVCLFVCLFDTWTLAPNPRLQLKFQLFVDCFYILLFTSQLKS